MHFIRNYLSSIPHSLRVRSIILKYRIRKNESRISKLIESILLYTIGFEVIYIAFRIFMELR